MLIVSRLRDLSYIIDISVIFFFLALSLQNLFNLTLRALTSYMEQYRAIMWRHIKIYWILPNCSSKYFNSYTHPQTVYERPHCFVVLPALDNFQTFKFLAYTNNMVHINKMISLYYIFNFRLFLVVTFTSLYVF